LLALTLSLGVLAHEARGKTHYFLLDDSGSMKSRYANNMRGWLFEPLLKSTSFSSDDRIIVRWFDQRGNSSFQSSDPQRKYDGKYDAQAVLNQMPSAANATGAQTNIPEGLELTLKDIEQLKVTDEVLIWLVTDNVQDVGGGGDVDPLYHRIKDDTSFQAAYIFPLTNENNAKLSPGDPAMVMYLLQFSKKPTRPGLDRLADDVGRRIGNVPVTWFPIDKGVDLNEAGIRVNGEPAALIDGKLKLSDVQEGSIPEFTLEFPFESKLRNLKIVQSKIIPQKTSSLTLPAGLEAQGDLNSWRGNISPTDLTLEAGKKSAVTYTTKLSGEMTFRPTSFWDALWNSTSDPIHATFDYKLMNVDAKMDLSGLNQVKNLQGIENNVRQSQKNVRSRSIPMSFQVQFNSLWRRVLAFLVLLALLLLSLGGASVFFIKSHYQLATPFGDQHLALPLFGRSYVIINGDRAAVIKRMGKPTITPLGPYTINGALQAHPLDQAINSFEIESQVDNRRYPYTLSRVTRAAGQPAVDRDDFLD
jgi:hypothetical protein